MSTDTRLLDVFEIPDEWPSILAKVGIETVGDLLDRARRSYGPGGQTCPDFNRRRANPGRQAIASVLWDATLFALPWSDCLKLYDAVLPAIHAAERAEKRAVPA
ncbi:MAG: hypothetical protein KF873_02135 [Gemmataceae bacterium]|nr:hypothetical protein [Gemmataceae bacterium]